jgi:hypothetical protein
MCVFAGTCRAPSNPPAGAAVRLAGVTNYPPTRSESALMAAVAKQPTVIYFEVVGDFFSYSGGVYVPSSCGTAINHAMVRRGHLGRGLCLLGLLVPWLLVGSFNT